MSQGKKQACRANCAHRGDWKRNAVGADRLGVGVADGDREEFQAGPPDRKGGTAENRIPS